MELLISRLGIMTPLRSASPTTTIHRMTDHQKHPQLMNRDCRVIMHVLKRVFLNNNDVVGVVLLLFLLSINVDEVRK